MHFTIDPLEEWALHCHRRGATISLDSSGAPSPGPLEEWCGSVDAESIDEAGAEDRLRQALAAAYRVEPDMVALAQGAQHADFLFFLTTLSPVDVAVVENPTFMPIRHQAQAFCQVRSLPRRAEDGYDPRPAEYERSTQGAKVIAVTNLHNPSGATLGPGVLPDLVEVAARRGAILLCDEVFREMSYRPPSPPACLLGDNAVSVSSITKLNGLRSLRIGWLIGAPEVVNKMESARLYTSYRLPSLNCLIAARAVERREWFRQRVLDHAEMNLVELKAWLEQEPRVTCRLPHGGLMAHLILPPGVDDLEVGERLLDQGVAVGPGRYWGAPGTLRATFSCAPSDLRIGLETITTVLDQMAP